jgi:hypothetical protein
MARSVPRFLVATTLLAACVYGPAPEITFADDVPGDFREVATDAWARFTSAFGSRRDCLDPIQVDVAWELADRASYDPSVGVVTVRVPGTAPNLTASLVHEFANHLEFSCEAHRGLRPGFLEAAGLPPSTAWFGAARYEDVPSERFAESVVILVLGAPSRIGVHVGSDAVQVVRAWAAAG